MPRNNPMLNTLLETRMDRTNDIKLLKQVVQRLNKVALRQEEHIASWNTFVTGWNAFAVVGGAATTTDATAVAGTAFAVADMLPIGSKTVPVVGGTEPEEA